MSKRTESMKSALPSFAPPQAEPRTGSRVTITLTSRDGSEVQVYGTVLGEPIRGTVGILLNGRFHTGRASAHTPTTVRLLIENRISVEPLAAVTLVRLDLPRNFAA